MTKKINLDKYYTSPETVTTCLTFLKTILAENRIKISDIIEPSAGNEPSVKE